MDVKLIVIGGKNAGKEIVVPGPTFVIGRAVDCQLRPGSDMVSRRHCQITVGQGSVTVRDLKSRNGTLVNGDRVSGERELKTGDLLEVGPLRFEVQLTVVVGGKKKPKVHSIGEAAARTVEGGPPSGGEDVDLGALMNEEEDEAEDEAASATPSPTTAAAGETVQANSPEAEASRKVTISKLSQLNAPKKIVAGSSRDAAAETLRKLMQGKR